MQRKEKIWQFDFGLVHTSYYQRKNSEVFEVLLKCLVRKSPDKVSKEDVEDFFDISDIMMDLKHENIIEFVGIVSYPYYIIVTEFVNENLKTHLKSVSHYHYNASDYHRICVQIASVLKYLELQRYVIHRKICCNSFLITANTATVKLFNFSRARKVDSDEFVGEETDDVDVIGAAPETLKSNFYSTKTDVWSAGFTFWEVFSKGERPFETTPLELYIAICYTGVFLEIPDSCPVGVFNVIKSCLRSKPEHRLTSAEL
uniref:Protein kinase domain-containing protein n=1 Tax=Helobdella robusta TaxID=6412 RepID=T1EI38_HELRO